MMDDALSAAMAPRVFNITLVGMFGAIAMILCAVDLYGVMTYAVTQRTREIGVRLALGAQRTEVLRLLMGKSARLLLTGLALGVAAALVAARLLERLTRSKPT